MSYELTENEAVTITEPENALSRKVLEDKCYSLDESKRLLLEKVHRHYHPEKSEI